MGFRLHGEFHELMIGRNKDSYRSKNLAGGVFLVTTASLSGTPTTSPTCRPADVSEPARNHQTRGTSGPKQCENAANGDRSTSPLQMPKHHRKRLESKLPMVLFCHQIANATGPILAGFAFINRRPALVGQKRARKKRGLCSPRGI